MSAETKKVLDLLAEGKISAADAERLLERLAAAGEIPGGRTDVGDEEPEAPRTGKPKFLRVVVKSDEGDNVNIRVPIALVRTGLKLTTMMPPEASQKLQEKGIDLSHLGDLKGEDLVEALRELTVDVHSHDGDEVRVFCE